MELDPKTSAARRRALSPAEILKRAELFAGLDAADLNELATRMRPCEFEPDDELCREGEPATRMLVIVDGLVHATVAGRTVAKRRHGEVIGAAKLVAGEPHAETVVARTPTMALELDAAAYREAVARHPRILTNVAAILGRRLAAAERRETRRDERGEVVALVLSPALKGAAGDVVDAARAASARAVDAVDTVVSLQETLATLDDRLADHGTVILTAGLHQDTLPLVLEHADRAVAVLGDPDEAAALEGLEAEALLVEPDPPSVWPAAVGGARVLRRLAAGTDAPLSEDAAAWLGRHLTRTKIGLALGAGGAKGFAHLGALYALEEAGYEIDVVSGASIGAVVGTCVALGMGAADVEELLRAQFTPERVAEVFSVSLAGGSTGLEAMTRSMRELAGERTFADVEVPLAIMSVDLDAAAPAPLREGELWEALMAATALAGMFPPYELGGRRLVDGLALIPVPTGALLEDGADVTVSVNLMSREVLPAWPGDEAPPEQPEIVKKRGSRMLDTLLAVMDLANLDNSIRHAALADVTITPRFGPATWKDFHLADLFLEAGRRAAEEALPALAARARPQQVRLTT
jgi:NTE family protein